MKKLLFAFLVILTTQISLAQSDPRLLCKAGDYLCADAGGGIQNISYGIGDNGDVKIGGGLSARLSLRHYFNPNFGIGAGVSYHGYHSSCQLNYLQIIDGNSFYTHYQHRTQLANVQEKQHIGIVSIPIGGYYQCDITNYIKLNVGIGLSAGIPAISKYETCGGNIFTDSFIGSSQDFADMEQTASEQTGAFKTGDIGARAGASLFADAGIGYSINKQTDITACMSLQYGFYYIKGDSEKPLFTPGGSDGCNYSMHAYNGALNSNIIGDNKTVQLSILIGLRRKVEFIGLFSHQKRKQSMKVKTL